MTVTVVGGGLAGAVAALAAARHRDVPVRLVAEGGATVRAADACVDVLGYVDEDGPLADPFAAIPDLPGEHPYRTVGVDAVRAGLALFDDATGGRYAGGERNALVPTVLGHLKPTARYPASLAPGVASREGPTLLVGFDRLTAFDAPLAAARLDDALPYRVWGETVSLPGAGDTLEAPALAAALDADRPVDGLTEPEAAEDGERVRDALARLLLDRVTGDDRVGLPAVLGYDAAGEIREGLALAAGADVFEVPLGPPGVPARRLEGLLGDRLAAAGVDTVDGQVVGARGDGRIDALELADGRTLETAATVLATGGLAAGGLTSDRRAIREPTLGCHVAHPGDRAEWGAAGALAPQPFASVGVDTDGRLRPTDARGDPEHPALRAAGRVLSGFDPAAEMSGGGVSVATGYVAGRLAAEDAS